MSDTRARMLRLLSLLQTHRDWSGTELAERLEVSPRTLRRDIDRLRVLGYPVQATRGSVGGYRLRAGAALPPLLLDDEEAVAIAVGLRTASAGTVAGIEETSVRALAKLEQVLPSRLRRRVNALQTYTVPLIAAGPTVDPNALSSIAQACRDHERLRFAYRSREGTDSRRVVEPHRLVSAGRRWYLVAWDVDRSDWRTFRVDRLDSPASQGVRFQPRELPGGDAATFVAQAIASHLSRHSAVVTLHAPVAVVADRIRPTDGLLEAVDEQTCQLRTGADSLEWLALSIGMLDVDFDIHEPPELVSYVRALSCRLDRSVRGATPAATAAPAPGHPVVVEYDPTWPAAAAELTAGLCHDLGPLAVHVDHIGSTAVPGMAAKDVLDVQVRVADLERAVAAFDVPLAALGFRRMPYHRDHVPAGCTDDPRRWAKRLWCRRNSAAPAVNLHARVVGSPNARLALLFRDWLRAHPEAVAPYAAFKRALAGLAPAVEVYADVKDPVVDLVIAVAEPWAAATGWQPA